MSTTFTWSIKHLLSLDSTQQGFVCRVFAEVTGTRDGVSVTYPADVSFKEPSETFIPYDQLTEQQVIDWVIAGLDPVTYETLVNAIDQAIDSQLNPPVTPQLTPLPWVTG
jgi:hypothetical protein